MARVDEPEDHKYTGEAGHHEDNGRGQAQNCQESEDLEGHRYVGGGFRHAYPELERRQRNKGSPVLGEGGGCPRREEDHGKKE
jgi:hypothetical protein